MTTLPASVTIVDLPAATLPLTGAELLETVQTNAGVGQSVQVAVSALSSIVGGLPIAGATGQLLTKIGASNFSAGWSSIVSFVSVGTSLATTGSATSIVAFVANAGIGSTQLATNAVQSSNITAGGVGSTQIANNAVGTNQIASSLGIASSLSVGTLLTVGGTATVTGTTILNGGLQVSGTTIATGTFGVNGTALFTSGTFGMVGTSQFTGSFNVVGTTNITGVLTNVGTAIITGGPFSVLGTSTFTGVHNVVGTTQVTGVFNVNGTTQFTSTIFGINATTIVTGTLILGNQASGFLVSSSTGVVGTAATLGNLVLLNTLTPNGVASATDTTSLTSTYKQYMVTFDNIVPAGQTTFFQIQVATTGTSWITAGVYANNLFYNTNATQLSDFTQTGILLSGNRSTTVIGTALFYGLSGAIKIYNPSNSTAVVFFNGETSWNVAGTLGLGSTTGSAFICIGTLSGFCNMSSLAPITGLNFQFASGNIATGTIKIYGIT